MIFLSMFARLIFSPLLVEMQADLGIGTAAATRFFLTISLGYTAAILLSGFISRHILHRGTIFASGVLVTAGLFWIGMAHRVPVMNVGFTMIGFGAGLYPPSGIASLVGLVHADIRGRAIAIHEIGPNFAFVAAPLAAAAVLSFASWRSAVVGTAFFAAVHTAAFRARGRGADFPGQVPTLGNLMTIWRIPAYWAILVFFTLAASSTIGVFSILPTYLTGIYGFQAPVVNTVLSLSRTVTIGILFVAGYLIDRFGIPRLTVAVIGVTAVLTLLLGILTGTPLLVAVFVHPIIITAFFPIAISAISNLGPPHLRSLTMSITVPVVNLVASGVFPALFGVLAERGLARWGFIGAGAIMALSLLLVPLLSSLNHAENVANAHPSL